MCFLGDNMSLWDESAAKTALSPQFPDIISWNQRSKSQNIDFRSARYPVAAFPAKPPSMPGGSKTAWKNEILQKTSNVRRKGVNGYFGSIRLKILGIKTYLDYFQLKKDDFLRLLQPKVAYYYNLGVCATGRPAGRHAPKNRNFRKLQF